MCTLEGEKAFTRAYLNENYLWYSEVPALDAASFTSLSDYFYSLLTPLLDSHGQPKDRFSFIARVADANSLTTGSNLGYGVQWEIDEQNRIRAAFIEAGSPAAGAGLQRGGELVSTTTPGASWFPNAAASISFVYRSTPAAATQSLTLTSAPVQEDPVPLVRTVATTGGRPVGYMLFNAHTSGAQDKLIPAVQAAQNAGVQDLVLDMRYNGGGYLYTALSLSSMLTGSANDGQIFEQLRYNDKRPQDTTASTMRFTSVVQVGEPAFAAGSPLPRLNLPRVYVLATGSTCSASESVINSLRGVGVQVNVIGESTCGKPYGFTRKDNCGIAYFPIEFQGVNAQGFGDYTTGFAPACGAADDFDHALGNTSERLLGTALFHIDSGTCPPAAHVFSAAAPLVSSRPALQRPPVRGRILLPAAP
jgi:C-terminal processing protease CtpA/Prc